MDTSYNIWILTHGSSFNGKITKEKMLPKFTVNRNNPKTTTYAEQPLFAIDSIWNLYQSDTAIFYKSGKNTMVITHYYDNRLRK
jgi:hypothetical protein